MTNVHYISSSTDALKQQLETIHSIVTDGSNTSSVMEYIYSTSRDKLIFQEKVYNLEAQIKILQESLALQSAEFCFQKSEYEKEIDQLKKEVSIGIENKVQNSQSQILNSKLQSELELVQDQFNQYKQSAQSDKTNSEEVKSQFDKEQKKCKSVMNKYKNLYSQYTDICKKCKQQEIENTSILNHIENERSEIYEMLNIVKDDISSEWINLTNKVKSILEENQSLTMNNEKLTKRIKVATNSIKEHQKLQDEMNQKLAQYEKISFSSPQSPNAISSSVSSPISKQISCYSSSSSSSPAMKSNKTSSPSCRTQFSIVIDKINFNSQNQIFNLYDSLIPNNTTKLRSICLSIIFVLRFKTYKSYSFDPTSLSLFYGRDGFSISHKIKLIGEKFTELTRDLLIVKQCRNETEARMISLNEKIKELEKEVSNKKELEIKIEWYKKRMIELQEYLSTLISPEQYHEARVRCDRLEQENYDSEQKRKSIEKEIEVYNQNSIEIAHQLTDLTICAEVKTQEAHEMRFECANKECEIESLKSIIQEKNKAILALERTLILQKQVNETTSSSLASLAIENQNLLKDSQSFFDTQHFVINPAFVPTVEI